MASTKSKFEGWKLWFNEANLDEVASGRVRKGNEDLILTRESDELEIKTGDTLLVTDEGEDIPAVVLIANISMGTDDYVVIHVAYFMRLSEVVDPPVGSVNQELFITGTLDKISVANIIERANVVNFNDFNQVAIDASNSDTTFTCRRGYDTYYKTYTEEIDFNSIKQGFIKDSQSQIEFLRSYIVKSNYIQKENSVEQSELVSQVAIITSTEPRLRATKVQKPASRVSTRLRNKKERKRLKEMVISDNESDDSIEVGVNVSSDEDLGVKNLNTGASDLSDSSDEELKLSSDEEIGFKNNKSNESIGKPKYFSHKKYYKGPKSLTAELVQDAKEGSDDEYEPNEISKKLPCREDQFTEIYYTLESAIELSSGTSLYISGPPGTGKTVTVREVVKQLHKQTKISNIPKFEYLEINGLKMITPQSAYEALWNKIATTKVPMNGLSGQLEDYFKLGKSEIPLVVLLDELDQIATSNQSILYNFFNWPTYENSKLILLAVANTMDLPERLLTNKTSSRLGLARIPFPGYSHEDLIKIIQSKLKYLEHDNIKIKKDSIEYASRRVASVSGDARRALKIIKRAIEISKENHESKEDIFVLPQHINRAISETTSSPVSNYILHLTFVGKLILVSILARVRKTGLAENTLGSVIDEMKNIIILNSAKDSTQFIIEGENILDILYEDFIIRSKGFNFVLNELIEAGIVLQQNVKTERNSMVKLNIPVEDITSVFKKESSLRFFASLVEQINE